MAPRRTPSRARSQPHRVPKLRWLLLLKRLAEVGGRAAAQAKAVGRVRIGCAGIQRLFLCASVTQL